MRETRSGFFGHFSLPVFFAGIFIAVLLMILTGGVYAASPVVVIALYDDSGRELFKFSPPDGRFTIRFLHSYARTYVDEVFQVDERNNILLKETIYEDLGAGLPHEPEHPMSSMTVENGKIYIRDIDRIVPNLQIRTGRLISEHTLIYGDKAEKVEKVEKNVAFSDFAAPGSVVIFKVN